MFSSLIVSHAQILMGSNPDPPFIFQGIIFEMCYFDMPPLDWWLRMFLLHLREFHKLIISKREFQVTYFNRCLHSVRRGVSLWQPVTYVIILHLERMKIKQIELQKEG